MKLATLACLAAVPLLAQSTGVIEGRVTNSVTSEALSGVTVRFLDSHDHVQQASTDAYGFYRLTKLEEGAYRGEFFKSGFGYGERKPPLQVSGGVAARQDAQLEPWAGLRGRVLDEDGNPASNIQVQIDRLQTVTSDEVHTERNGDFAFSNLSPGSFTLVAKPPPKVHTVNGVRIGAVPIYYPSVTDVSQAVPIVVGKGTDVSGIEIRLRSVPVHRVAGVVIAPSGKPARGATVKLMGMVGTARQTLNASVNLNANRPYVSLTTTGPGPAPEIARVVSGEDGEFEFPAVEQGDWRLSAALGEGDEALAAVTPALVSVRDVEGITLRLSAPFAAGVTAEWGDTKAPAWAERAANLLMLSPAEGQPRLFLDPAKYVGQIPGIFPGRYRAIPYNIPGFYPAAVMWGGRDVSGQLVEIAPGAPPFQVVFRSDVGTVHGTVDKGEGATVLLTPRNPGEISFIRQEPCGPGGVFDFTNVPPGDYYAVAFDRSDTRGLHTGEIPNVIIPIATSVRVESGASASVELRLNRWPW